MDPPDLRNLPGCALACCYLRAHVVGVASLDMGRHEGEWVRGHECWQRYETTDVTLTLQGQQVRITKIADLEVLLESVDAVTFAEDERLPYWAELWPAAVGLAQYTTQHLHLAGRRVLEVGCGLGLVSVTAALQGARVLCTDYEPDALVFARHNARRNACQQVRFRLVDWRWPALRRRYDYILASDVIYEARNFGPLTALLQRYLARGGRAVFSEPGRLNAVPFFALLRQRGFTYHKTIQPLEWDGSHQIAIYTIRHRQALSLIRHHGLALAGGECSYPMKDDSWRT